MFAQMNVSAVTSDETPEDALDDPQPSFSEDHAAAIVNIAEHYLATAPPRKMAKKHSMAQRDMKSSFTLTLTNGNPPLIDRS